MLYHGGGVGENTWVEEGCAGGEGVEELGWGEGEGEGEGQGVWDARGLALAVFGFDEGRYG